MAIVATLLGTHLVTVNGDKNFEALRCLVWLVFLGGSTVFRQAGADWEDPHWPQVRLSSARKPS